MKFPRPTDRVGECIGFMHFAKVGCPRGNAKMILSKQKRAIVYDGEEWISSRLSYHLNVARIPRSIGKAAKKGQICHHCDNDWCIKPSHLYLGSKSTNIIDVYNRNPQSIHTPAASRARSKWWKQFWSDPRKRKRASEKMLGNTLGRLSKGHRPGIRKKL